MRNRILSLALLVMLGAFAGLYAQNGCMYFDGVDDYVSITGGTLWTGMSGATGLTVEAWINPASLANGLRRNTIVDFCIAGTNSMVNMYLLESGKIRLGGRSISADNFQGLITSAPVITTNVWQHVAGVLDFTNKTVRVYVDGELVGSLDNALWASNTFTPGAGGAQFIGASASLNNTMFGHGWMDDLRLWREPRSLESIAENMNTIVAPQPGLLAYWKFDGDSSDSSGNGYTGTEIGGPEYQPGLPLSIQLFIDENVSYLDYGESVTLDVNISGILASDPMRGFEMQVNYDPEYLTADALDFVEGTFLSSYAVSQGTQFYVRGVGGAWIVSCAILSVPPGTWDQPFGASGDGILFSVTLTARQQPSCYTAIPVTLTDITLRDEVNQPLYTDSVKGADVYIKPTLVIPLGTGWNRISSWVIPQDLSLEAVFSQLITDGYLIKVQDEDGNYLLKTLSGIWQNTIGDYQMDEGYYVRVNNDCNLIIQGSCIILPMTVELRAGWNMVPFPYHDPQTAMSVLQPLIDANLLVKAQDEAGNAIVKNLSGVWIDDIGNFEEGESYYIRVSADTQIIYDVTIAP